jgi:hypothetical protein
MPRHHDRRTRPRRLLAVAKVGHPENVHRLSYRAAPEGRDSGTRQHDGCANSANACREEAGQTTVRWTDARG